MTVERSPERAPGRKAGERLPLALLGALLAAWLGIGAWIVVSAPFASGTDESIRYAAFAAAENRWATEEDFRRHGIDHFYYPPLYFLLFAPFWGDEPSFVREYPQGEGLDKNYMSHAGRRMRSAEYLASIPPPLVRLYRSGKALSLGLGLAVLLALAATLRLLFPGPEGWWVVLLGTAPVVLLPQFLYYQTLVNNDALLNALAALATLAFTAAVLAAERGEQRRFLALGATVGACLGLAFLTKMSAPVLLPLALGILWVRLAADAGLPWRRRAARLGALAAVLAAVCFLSGGWWLAYKAAQGDWTSSKAHQLAHPWAKVAAGFLSDPHWWGTQVLQIARSYYAQFAGALFLAVPDTVILLWVLVPAGAAGLLCVALALRLGERRAAPSAGQPRRFRAPLWVALSAVLLVNAGAVMLNLRIFLAAYGRLLFPSLVAIHVIGAAAAARVLRGRPRALGAAALGVVALCGSLFAWTVPHRLAPAVRQPPEDVRVLTGVRRNVLTKSVWEVLPAQPLLIPAGELTALRVSIFRVGSWPQLGAAIEGSLRLALPGGAERVVGVGRTGLGDATLSQDWIELELEQSVRLDTLTSAVLTLRASPPWWPRDHRGFRYNCARAGMPATLGGARSDCALCVAAVFRPRGEPDTRGGP